MKKNKIFMFFSFIFIALAVLCLSIGGKTLIFRADDSIYKEGDMRASTLPATSNILSNDYINLYGVPTSYFTYKENAQSKANLPLSNAFDRDFNTRWQSEYANNMGNGQGGPSFDSFTNEYTTNLKNKIQVDFSSPITINRIFYFTERDGGSKGYPEKLRVYSYIKQDDSWQEVGYCNSTPTTSYVLFTLSSPVEFSKLRLEWELVDKRHSWNAEAREIIFFQPENSSVEEVRNIFTDYAQHNLAEGINAERLTFLRESLKDNIAFDDGLKELLDRAELVLNNSIMFDPAREFTTNPEGKNVLSRVGNVASYARSTLMMDFLGTNRQVTGISANAGDVLVVYVDANDGDKLPSIRYSQFWGHWKKWLGGSIPLKKGKNIINVQNILTPDVYSEALRETLIAGGPIYLENPYKPNEQSENVKVYIEGGTPFPVFHIDGDQQQYKLELEEYMKKIESDPEHIIDQTELVSKRFIMTVRASSADNIYNNQGYSAQTNLEFWDDYFKQVMEFDGVVYDDGQEYYNEMNQYVNCNIRLMQPYGGAYAHLEHVGIQPGWEGGAIFSTSTGWGSTHELGHMMDIGKRILSECSNNMMSKFNEVYLERLTNRGGFDGILANLTPDDRSSESYFDSTKRSDYLIWWLIESYQPGYWAKLEQYYRYKDRDIPLTSRTEKQVYFSSLVTGIDLSYYFERWGYMMDGDTKYFTRASASQEFNDLMAKAKQDNLITREDAPKIWYLDKDQYLLKREQNISSCYTGQEEVSILSIAKTGDGHYLRLSSSLANNPAHLGYEILKEIDGSFKVIGFTYTNSYFDPDTSVSNPVYKVVAYDRDLKTSRESNPARETTDADVCRIDSISYPSLAEAILNASENDVIELLKDFSFYPITIDKRVTIAPASELTDSITLTRVTSGDLITILDGASLIILGTEKCKIVFDGQSFSQPGAIINCQGSLTMEYVDLTNNINSGDGGAIILNQYASLSANHINISSNSSNRGGAIAVIFARVNANISNSSFTSNSSKQGGAIYNVGTMNFNDCNFSQNSASEVGGAVYNCSGGVLAFSVCSFTQNSANLGGGLNVDGKTTLTNCTLSDNTAQEKGGGIYYSTTIWARELFIYSQTSISQNNAKEGKEIYMQSGTMYAKESTLSGSNSSEFDLLLAGGNFRLYGSCTLDGNMFLGSANVVVYDKMFSTSSLLAIYKENLQSGSVIFSANNFNFADEDALSISLENGTAEVGENPKEMVSSIEDVEITFSYGTSSSKQTFAKGTKFVLPSEVEDPTKYVTKWHISGKEYEPLSEVVISQADTFTADVQDKFSIKINILGREQITYVVPNTIFNLPSTISGDDLKGVKILYYTLGNKTYVPLSSIVCDSSKEFTAITENKLEVSFECLGVVFLTEYYSYNDYIVFPSIPNIPTGYCLKEWRLDGEEVKSVTARSSMKFVAELEKIKLYVEFYYDNPTQIFKTDQYEYGDVVNLSDIPTPEGYKVSALYIGEEKVPLGHSFTIEDMIFVRVELEKIVLNFSIKINEEVVSEQEVEYGTNVSLPSLYTSPEGFEVDYYLVNGQRYDKNISSLQIKVDTIVEVVLKEISKPEKEPNKLPKIVIPLITICGVVLAVLIGLIVVFVKKKKK